MSYIETNQPHQECHNYLHKLDNTQSLKMKGARLVLYVRHGGGKEQHDVLISLIIGYEDYT